jgi:formylmethanofuran dehydrogenase subunit A
MRQECQALIVTFNDGEVLALTHPMTVESASAIDWPGAYVCGKPAVDCLDAVRFLPEQPSGNIMDRIQHVSFPLCAEHWDQYETQMKEAMEDAGTDTI